MTMEMIVAQVMKVFRSVKAKETATLQLDILTEVSGLS